MLYTLENEKFKIIANNHGAELSSISSKEDGTEYLWNGNKKYWGYHAPVLFPIVGKVKDGIYRVDGKEYNLKVITTSERGTGSPRSQGF